MRKGKVKFYENKKSTLCSSGCYNAGSNSFRILRRKFKQDL